MLAYAASRPQLVERRSAPHAMLGIIAVHIGLLAVVMSAKMDFPRVIGDAPLVVDLIHEDDPPPQRVIEPRARAVPRPSQMSRPQPPVSLPDAGAQSADWVPVPLPDFGDMVRPLPDDGPAIRPTPVPAPVKLAAHLMTSASNLKPPYPASKLASGEEATLRLRLSIDAKGRVTAVEPIGPAERAFLEAARRHLLAHWRYRPASADGLPVASSTVVTLHFRLEG